MPVTGGADFLVKVQFDFAVVEQHGELGAAGMEVKPAGGAVVNESRHVLLARVAVTRHRPRRPAKELERAFGVERVGDGGGRDGAMRVQVKVATSATVSAAGAPVARPYPGLLAAVALEGRLRVLEFEVVVRVAEVADFIVFHGSSFVNTISTREISYDYI